MKNRYKCWYIIVLIATLICLAGTGCTTCCAHKGCSSSVTTFDDYTNFFCHWDSTTKLTVFETDGLRHSVFSEIDTNQPAILLLHELPGMTPQCLSLATNIASRGYTVYLPLMFGRPDENNDLSTIWNTVFLLLDCKWSLFHKYETPGIVKDLKIITNEIEQRQGPKKMGVVGMCLTGTLPLSLLSNTNVETLVLSQPAMPFGFTSAQKSALGLSFADMCFAVNRVSQEQLTILGLRFASDTICTSNRFNSLHQLFGSNFHDLTIPEYECRTNICTTLHSVLCEQYDNAPGSPTRNRFDAMMANFDKCLKPEKPAAIN